MNVFLDFPLLSIFVVIVSIIVIYKVAAVRLGAGRDKEARECQKCGTSLPRNASYCRRCGAKLES
jgi:hypothetical protein